MHAQEAAFAPSCELSDRSERLKQLAGELQARLATQPAAAGDRPERVAGDALTALATFHAELRTQGIELIVLPLPLLADSGVGRGTGLWSELTPALLALLAEEVEVIDQRRAWTARPQGRGTATAELLVGRLRCYRWIEPISGDYPRDPSAPDAPDAPTAPYVGPLLLMGDESVVASLDASIETPFHELLSAKLGMPVAFAGYRGGGSAVAWNYARWFANVVPRPRLVVAMFDAFALLEPGWPAARFVLDALAVAPPGLMPEMVENLRGVRVPAFGSAGPPQVQRVTGELVAVSASPDPRRVVYGNVVAVAELQVDQPHRLGRIAILGTVIRDGERTAIASIRAGQRVAMTVQGLGSAGELALQEMMVVDDTDAFDLDRYVIRDWQPLPPLAGAGG